VPQPLEIHGGEVEVGLDKLALATGLDGKDKKVQVATLLTVIALVRKLVSILKTIQPSASFAVQ
jgi:hypothetical protein